MPRVSPIVLALAAVLACNNGTEPGTLLTASGTYVAFGGAASAKRGTLTATNTTTGDVTDLLDAGASITLELRDDGTTLGHVFVPDPNGPDLNADLTGTWTLTGTTVRLTHTSDTFLRDIPFDATGDALVGEGTFSGTRISVRIEKTT